MERYEDCAGHHHEFPERLQQAIAVLSEASGYAHHTTGDPWEFAVEIEQFREMGLSANDLRFLVRQGLVTHAREITIVGQDGRRFQPTGDLTFTKRTCFILAPNGGSSNGREVPENDGEKCRDNDRADPGGSASVAAERAAPKWNSQKRELRVGDRIVKRFKWHAENQERILMAFEEEAWPSRIDDPLPPHDEQDAKRRLSDTIKCLNRKQINRILHFRGDGTGEGVVWEFVGQDD